MRKGLQIPSYHFFLLVFWFAMTGCFEETPLEETPSPYEAVRILTFDDINGMVDLIDRTIMFTLPKDSLMTFAPEVKFHDYRVLWFEGRSLDNGKINDLGQILVNRPYEVVAENNQTRDTFQLLFTTLPLVHVKTLEPIPDAPKVPARMEFHFSHGESVQPVIQHFHSFAGIEIRGGSSTRYEKKSFGFELRENETGGDYFTSLLGMRVGEDWILDAMYVDPLRMRNKLSFDLWKKLSQIPDEDQREDLYPGIDCNYVELFINDRYHGLYSLNEKIDEFRLQYSRSQAEQGGVLYKAIEWAEGSTTFDSVHSDPPQSFYWDGWEQVYPHDEYQWDPLSELRNLIVYGTDESFTDGIEYLIDLDNALNFYLFINITAAGDNVGKNTFLARYTHSSRFFLMPWDIEASWGKMWDGTDSSPWGFAYNRLFTRLIATNCENFETLTRSTWKAYRETIFHQDSLVSMINSNTRKLINSGVFGRENNRWEGVHIEFDAEVAYALDWLDARLEFLDKAFSQNSELK